ncbi:hypothetical protein GJ496_008114 [Pomphorhynchus laevis]|nr:hypothetical protein GJ496_008114 [Pomphorhynchus laevis]
MDCTFVAKLQLDASRKLCASYNSDMVGEDLQEHQQQISKIIADTRLNAFEERISLAKNKLSEETQNAINFACINGASS